MMLSETALTVSQVTTYVKMLFEADYRLKNISVVGEISNFSRHFRTGHCYFTLKDATASIKAVMFSGNADHLTFEPGNGMTVIVSGRIGVYERDGVYQLYAERMQPAGIGEYLVQIELLKEKLRTEGLFDAALKKAIPAFPRRVGLITSASGAALYDVLNVLSRRYPLCEIIFYPVTAQGADCAPSNIRAIQKMNDLHIADVILLCRGGGSSEDLMGYQQESLVRAVAASQIPVITGIGHETDVTLCDYAADCRAPTPSAAAELAVPDKNSLLQACDELSERLQMCVTQKIRDCKNLSEKSALRLRRQDPRLRLKEKAQSCVSTRARLDFVFHKYFEDRERRLSLLLRRLQTAGMQLHGKSSGIFLQNGDRLTSVRQVRADDRLTVILADGMIDTTVNKVELY